MQAVPGRCLVAAPLENFSRKELNALVRELLEGCDDRPP